MKILLLKTILFGLTLILNAAARKHAVVAKAMRRHACIVQIRLKGSPRFQCNK